MWPFTKQPEPTPTASDYLMPNIPPEGLYTAKLVKAEARVASSRVIAYLNIRLETPENGPVFMELFGPSRANWEPALAKWYGEGWPWFEVDARVLAKIISSKAGASIQVQVRHNYTDKHMFPSAHFPEPSI